jgi:hypothetical protein
MRTARLIPNQDTPAGRLIAALGLELRATAVVQDLYNRPIVPAPAVRRLEPRRQPAPVPNLAA